MALLIQRTLATTNSDLVAVVASGDWTSQVTLLALFLQVDHVHKLLLDNQAKIGATQNRINYTISNLMNISEQTTAARSRIEDADFATESAALAKTQVLQQTATAMLAQANARPQLVLQLVK